MHGVAFVEYDQSALGYPFLQQKAEAGDMETFTYFMRGREYFTTPHIRMAFDHGVRMAIHRCEYTTKTMNPYTAYMEHFMHNKNGADVVKSRLGKKRKTEGLCAEEEAELRKANYDRTIAKLFLNSLLGRNNMKLDRKQTVLTGSPNDLVSLLADDEHYSSFSVDQIRDDVFRASFHEGGYQAHIGKFNVVPYLSGYMLSYAKMLIAASFQRLHAIGAQLLYTDTDSIAFSATPQQWEAYSGQFVPSTKTFGGMELEGVYAEICSVGPKKYACVKANGDYEWAGNGIRGRENAHRDILQLYRQVLAGDVVETDYFSINTTRDFRLTHTTRAARKKIRFLSLKGAVEKTEAGADTIRWWNDFEEFREHASGVVPLGFERTAAGERRKIKSPPGEIRVPSQARAVEPGVKTPPPPPKRAAAQPVSWIYVLKTEEDDTYVGSSMDVGRRLTRHNAGTGGDATKRAVDDGKEWSVLMTFGPFTTRQQALTYEYAMHNFNVTAPGEWEEIGMKIASKRREYREVRCQRRM